MNKNATITLMKIKHPSLHANDVKNNNRMVLSSGEFSISVVNLYTVHFLSESSAKRRRV